MTPKKASMIASMCLPVNSPVFAERSLIVVTSSSSFGGVEVGGVGGTFAVFRVIDKEAEILDAAIDQLARLANIDFQRLQPVGLQRDSEGLALGVFHADDAHLAAGQAVQRDRDRARLGDLVQQLHRVAVADRAVGEHDE